MIRDPRRITWDYLARTYLYNQTKGRPSQLSSLVIAIAGQIQYPPAFMPVLPTKNPLVDIGGMRIEKEGACLVLYKASARAQWEERCIYTEVQLFTDTFRGLADACKMNDAQTIAMFDAVKKFIRVDERPQNTHLFD